MRDMRKRQAIKALFIVGIVAALAARMGLAAPPAALAASAGDWPGYLFGDGRDGYNASETSVSASTAHNLHIAWTHGTGGAISTQPVVANNMVYWGSWDGYEHATAFNNAKVWATNLGVTNSPGCGATVGIASTPTVATVPINGTATSTVFVGGGNAVFYALNALTGKVLWQTRLGPSPAAFIWSSPAVFQGSAYVGLASLGDCPLVQGQLVQLNASTGALQHRFNLVPNGCTGGTVWGSPAIDDAAGALYIATGNIGPCSTREPYAQAIVKLTTANLSYVSSWQVPASEMVTDSDFGSTPTLFSASINGMNRSLLGVANKSGWYYVLNRNAIGTGPIWKTHIANGGSQPEGSNGQGSISPSAWDGTSLYAGGGATTISGTSCKGSIRALNPATGAQRWAICLLSGPLVGAVSAVPGIVVIGEGSHLLVIAASSGAILYHYYEQPGHFFYGAATIAHGVLYIGNMDGILYAFKP